MIFKSIWIDTEQFLLKNLQNFFKIYVDGAMMIIVLGVS